MVAWRVSFVAALAVLLPTALGQLPDFPEPPENPVTDAGETQIQVRIEEVSGKISVEEPARFTITVRNLADPENPLSQPVDVRLEVVGMPDGWTASLMPGTVPGVEPGREKNAVLQVSVATEAEAQSATLTVTGSVGEGPAAPVVDQSAQDSVQIDIQREDPTTRRVLEALGQWIWPLIVGAIALLLLVVKLMADRNKTPVLLTSSGHHVEVARGKAKTIELFVQNLTRGAEMFTFFATPLPGGWDASLGSSGVRLEAGEQDALLVRIEAPKERASPQKLTITATAMNAPGKPSSVTFDLAQE